MGRTAASRTQLGPYWLWYRSERDEWSICWYDDTGANGRGRTCRRGTGVRGGSAGTPPPEALDALASHYQESQRPTQQPIGAASVQEIVNSWLEKHAYPNLSDPIRYRDGARRWREFFDEERRAGRLTGPPTVADINSDLVRRFHAWRRQQGVGGHTIARDTAALRQPLNWAWKNNLIPSAPFVPDVRSTEKAEPRDLVYSIEQIAALLEAARATPEREHIHLFAMLMLSTNGRVEAVLELEAAQIQDGLIYFNAPGRAQTKKRRSVVPVCPTLAPWLVGASGRLIQWRKRVRWSAELGDYEYERRPADSIKKAFEGTLVAAGITERSHDADGEPVWLPARGRLGETAPRPKLVGLGSPNTLRHTTNTHMHARGVPEAQIETAAGHRGTGTNQRHYRHLRPEYLTQFIDGVESLWADIGKLTTAHLRADQRPKVVALSTPVSW